jgi:multimeric flavodoxin WrbA
MKEVIVFNGSPRMDGNIATLLGAVARGAQDNGAQVKTYTLFKMKFMACQSCFYCRLHDDCIINDELREALGKLKTAHAVVIGSPIYMMQMTGPVKNLYDRLFPLIDTQGRPDSAEKILTSILRAWTTPALSSVFRLHGRAFPSLGFQLTENIVCTNGNDPESAEVTSSL